MNATTKPINEARDELRDAREATGGALHTLSSVGYQISISILDHMAETWIVVPVRQGLGPVGTSLDHVAFFTGPTAQADAICAAANQVAADLEAETGKPEPRIGVDGLRTAAARNHLEVR